MLTGYPEDEDYRVRKLHEHLILDTPPEQTYDDIAELAAMVCGTAYALVTLVDRYREWFKAKKGLSLNEIARESGFCSQTILHQDVMIVVNADHDPRFLNNVLVTATPPICFYAGVPVRASTGEPLGTVCVLDALPRTLDFRQTEALKALARQVSMALELRHQQLYPDGILASIQYAAPFANFILNALPIQYCALDGTGHILALNRSWLDFDLTHNNTARPASIGQNYLALLEGGFAENRGGKAFSEGLRAILKGEKNHFTLEYSYRRLSEQHWFVGKVSRCCELGQNGIIVIYENISEHKHLEFRFQQAVEAAPNAMVMVDESGTIQMVNLQTEISFGYPRTELLGQPVEMLVPERFRRAHVGVRQAYLAAPMSRPMGAGRDLYGLRKNGSEFPVEIGLGLIDDANGILVLSSIVDITERKRLDQRFRQAVEVAPNAIVMVNESGTIQMVNLQTEISFGYPRAELLGQPVEMLVPERFRKAHVGFRQAYLSNPVSRPMGVGRDLYGLRKDGSEFPVEIGLGLIDDANGTIVLTSIIDITGRKTANDKLKQALNEKEVLLKEVYHRVKNNLQVVSSLINLQARNVKNAETVDLLKQSADRIKAMAILHEKLYQSKDLARIDFNAYIHSLADHLLYGYGEGSDKIQISLRIDDIFLDVDTAIPCGLIISELLTNSLKHAFPEGRRGTIAITFTEDAGEFILVIADTGVGFPSSVDFRNSTSLGLQLVTTLTNQLMGEMTLDGQDGAAFTLRFANAF
ncbi:PAS domain S-box protein [Methylovulum psychrotolerans]|uniref:PAS domain S-box protein n=1 Tax=Methylovulum psychrotolerans TaxID=1704499 RepID=UPI001BFF84FE|nr:PAS domain S-box protein [Methylovulum psychrotolerans]MBT9099578.1 PAS domain S-box protein [Methylovulum psychrotolerans]